MYGKGKVEFEESTEKTMTTTQANQSSSTEGTQKMDSPEGKKGSSAAVASESQATKEPKKRRRGRVTVRSIRRMKQRGEKITMLTAYDAMFASLLDRAGVEMLLVGDSLGMVIQGGEDTLSVTLDEMIYHTRCVSRGAKTAMVVGDMPFMTYQISSEQALRSAGRLIQEGGAQAVKLEGGREVAESIKRITTAGIPVVGHLGLTPQSIHALGGFVVQGRKPERAQKLIEDALILQEAGIFCLVLECIPAYLAEEITAKLDIPTIGIGAGQSCDGQVLVINDLIGLNPDFQPKFVKKYADAYSLVMGAVQQYLDEVKNSQFPTQEHSF